MHTNSTLNDTSNVASRFESDKYHLLEKIGEGGFGQIYKARHLVTKQLVAIKILTLNQDFEEDKKKRHIARFEREALLGSELQHPNIVRLLDKGNCNNILWFCRT